MHATPIFLFRIPSNSLYDTNKNFYSKPFRQQRFFETTKEATWIHYLYNWSHNIMMPVVIRYIVISHKIHKCPHFTARRLLQHESPIDKGSMQFIARLSIQSISETCYSKYKMFIKIHVCEATPLKTCKRYGTSMGLLQLLKFYFIGFMWSWYPKHLFAIYRAKEWKQKKCNISPAYILVLSAYSTA